MNDLPDLPFFEILGHLNLADLIRSRAVSRGWRKTIDRFRVKSLCFSEEPIELVFEKSRWVSAAFAQNFINSPRFGSFFGTFSDTILASLEHLRLCDLGLNANEKIAFGFILSAFDQLKRLDIVRIYIRANTRPGVDLELNLLMLESIQLEEVHGIRKMTLDAPRLQQVQLCDCLPLRLDLVHPEQVQKLFIEHLEQIEVKRLKNLQVLYTDYPKMDATLLSTLKQLKQVHLCNNESVSQLFEQRQRYDRLDLKFIYMGLPLRNPDDWPAIDFSPYHLNEEAFSYLTANQSELADAIPFCRVLYYEAIRNVAPDRAANIANRFTRLFRIQVDESVRDVRHFAEFLRALASIAELEFSCDQPQCLFDNLPDCCTAIQRLILHRMCPDASFLFRLNSLIGLRVHGSIDAELIRRILERLDFISELKLRYGNRLVQIRIDRPKQFLISAGRRHKKTSSLEAAIQFIKNNPQKKRKAQALFD